MTNEILALLANNLKYGAYVYTQLSTPATVWDGDYKIEFLYEQLPDNCLVFMVPKYSSLSTKQTDGTEKTINANKLTIKYLVSTEIVNGVKRGKYTSKSYNIYVESPEGILTLATKGDIIANRLAIFRFIKGDNDSVILVNSPLYNSVSLSTLTVTNKATFFTRPVVVDNATNSEIPLATNTDLRALEERVEKLENKFQYGTKDPEEALLDAEIGTIYIRVEEGE
jgi:hypothetical protein